MMDSNNRQVVDKQKSHSEAPVSPHTVLLIIPGVCSEDCI